MNNQEINTYRKARVRAAELNNKFKSREGASELIGVSKDSLTNYELDQCKQVPADVVIKMADAYNAPELLNNYCCNECPIGKLTISPICQENIDNIYKLAIDFITFLSDGNEDAKMLLDIVKDGNIDEREMKYARNLFVKYKSFTGLINDFGIVIEKFKG